MRRAGRHMRAKERRALAHCTEAALQLYRWQHVRAKQRGLALWKLLPKLHAWSHIAYDNGGTNPRHVHCYVDEDMVGRMKRLYVRCHARSAPSTALLRYILLQCMHWLDKFEQAHPRLQPQPARQAKRRRVAP